MLETGRHDYLLEQEYLQNNFKGFVRKPARVLFNRVCPKFAFAYLLFNA